MLKIMVKSKIKSIKQYFEKTGYGCIIRLDDEEENPYLSKSDIEDEEKKRKNKTRLRPKRV